MELFDLIFASLDPKVAKYITLTFAGLSAALPLLTWLANLTSNTWDNRAVEFLRTKVLPFIPRVRFGDKPAPSRSSAPTVPETPSAKAKSYLGS